MKWFKLLIPGIFDTIGPGGKKKTVEITSNDLDAVVKNYNAAQFAAAFCIGHPKTQKEPAYGFVDALKRIGDAVYFAPGKMVAEFKKAVNDGMFPRVSAGLENTENGWTLNHVAFLGAWKPAVPGLGMVEFADPQPEIATAELAEWKDPAAEFAARNETINWIESRLNSIARVLSGVREYIIETAGVDKADKILCGSDLEYVGSPAPEYVEEAATAFARRQPAPGAEALLAAAETEKASLAAALQEANTRIAAFEKTNHESFLAAARAQFAGYVDEQIKDRRVLPAEKPFIVDTLMALSKAETAKGDDLALLAAAPDVVAYRRQIEVRPQHNLTRETAVGGTGETALSAVELAAFAEQHVAAESAKGIKVSYADAVGYVRDHPEAFAKKQ